MAERKCLQKQQWWNSGQALKLDNGLIQHCWGQKDQEGPLLGTEFVRLLFCEVNTLFKKSVSSVVSDSFQPHVLQHTRLPCPSPNTWSLLKLTSTESVPSNHLILCHPFSSCLQYFPASGSFQGVSSSDQVAKVLELQLHSQSSQWVFRVYFL